MIRKASWNLTLRTEWENWRDVDTGIADTPAWQLVTGDEPLDEWDKARTASLEFRSDGKNHVDIKTFWRLVGQIIGAGKGELWLSCEDEGGIVRFSACIDAPRAGESVFSEHRMDDDKQQRIDAAIKILYGDRQ